MSIDYVGHSLSGNEEIGPYARLDQLLRFGHQRIFIILLIYH